MNTKFIRRTVILLVVFFLAVYVGIPQNLKPDEELIEEKGILHFNDGEYSKALFYFNKLLELYPRDPFFNYYAGVSNTELEKKLVEAIYQLKIASLKDVPGNVYFFLGKAHHISNNYSEALKYYERYLSVGDEKEIVEFQVRRLAQMCRSKVDPATSGSGVEKVNRRSAEISVSAKETVVTGEEKPSSAGQQEETGYDKLVEEALKWQIKADSVRRLSNEKRQYLTQISGQAEREKAEKEILRFEEEAYNYQAKADELYLRVKDLEQAMKGKPDMALSSFEENIMHVENQQFIEHLEKINPFEGQRTIDNFYNTDEYNHFFRSRDMRIINDAEVYIKEGDNYMDDVFAFQKELEREKVRISNLTNTKDRKKSRKTILTLEGKIKKKVTFASKYYQEANAMKYVVFKGILEDRNTENTNKEMQKNVLKFQEMADSNMETAIELAKQGRDAGNEEEKFDNLLKTNAYEVMALQNQKKAFGIFAGIVPVESKEQILSMPEVSEESGTLIKDTQIAKTEEKEKLPELEKITEEPPVLAVKEEQEEITEEDTEVPVEEIIEPETSVKEDALIEKTSKTATLIYGFQILRKSPYSAANPFPGEKEFPGRLVYRIQIAAYKSQISYDFFKGMAPITTEKISNSDITRYFAGLFKTYEAAQNALKEVRNEGFSDAYIVVYFDGRKISLNRAKTLEKF
ncbi:MAG: hypothetical protein IIB05_03810 [Bacteroidetes bacterium]|nr:hypothetical protein [Bacteroidota bacterium]